MNTERKQRKQQLEEAYGTDESIGLDEEGLLPDGESACVCTNVAFYIAKQVKGAKIFGFAEWDNPSSAISEDYDGHDFAMVDGFIIDPWVSQTENYSKKSVFDTMDQDDSKEIKRIYGNRKKWKGLKELNKELKEFHKNL